MLHLPPIRQWAIWSLFFESECKHCGKALAPSAILFCEKCWASLPRAERTPADKLPKHVDAVFAAYAFHEGNITREIVHALKFDGIVELAPRMAESLLRSVPLGYLSTDDVCVPVPLHWLRRGDRSFNQSELLTSEVCKRTGVQKAETLRRVRNTPAQTGQQGIRARAANVLDAFSIRTGEPVPESVMLVDDVVTTGATVSECAKVLKDSGVKRVRVLAFARAV
ncbi:MAG: ComF family protein [Calditrichaeota bacterium]|nr:ComF family protein [Calditrichota bacterium]MCB9391081.1 ComF family protein [Calditrichota bacterium]